MILEDTLSAEEYGVGFKKGNTELRDKVQKTLEEMGDKIPAGDKGDIESKLNALKDALKGTDTNAIKNATEELTKAFYAVSEKLYSQNGGQAGPDMGGASGGAGATGNGGDDNVVDADYEVVDDDKK